MPVIRRRCAPDPGGIVTFIAVPHRSGLLPRLAGGQSCAQPIPYERLEAIPTTPFCVDCPRTGGLIG